jgi:N,N'-diacetyllegionaminate synthase
VFEKAMGSGIKRPQKSEAKNKSAVRKSLVAKCPIRTGEIFSETNITVKRPGTGLSPMCWDEVLGCKAPRDFDVDELIEL